MGASGFELIWWQILLDEVQDVTPCALAFAIVQQKCVRCVA
jgi:hypothetical protein